MDFSVNSDNESILSVYRERLMLRFMLVFIPLFLPLTLFNVVREHYVLAAALGGILIVVLINIAAIHFKKYVLVARTAFIVGLLILVGIALINRGEYGTYWTYPIVVFISFSMSRGWAKLYTAIFFVYCTALMFELLAAGLALRAVFGLGVTILFTNIFLDIIEKLQEKLIEQSLRDPLTKAFNRRQMLPSLEQAAERKRRTEAPASILIFDIDDFKSINDNYGHSVGDHVLKEFVALVGKRARQFDQLFRIGGEEFMLFLPDTPENGALTLAEELCDLISKAEFIKDRPVTVSIGLSELNEGETVDEWMKRGDNALYAAKENGRNQVFSRTSLATQNCLNIANDSILSAASL